jgi:hypothetical protein
MLLISTYFYFQLSPYGQTMAGSISPDDPTVAFLPLGPIVVASVVLSPLHAKSSPFQNLSQLWPESSCPL